MSLLKEPLLWFVAIAALLFAATSWFDRASDPVVLDTSVRERITHLWQAQMGRAPSDTELASLVHEWVREEVFYREALRLGLDRDDTIVRRRLVQKLGFMIQDVEDEIASQDELQSYYESNLKKYTSAERYSLKQILAKTPADIDVLRTRLQQGENWQAIGENTLLPGQLVAGSEREITSEFGAEFAAELHQLVIDEWVGPIPSPFGHHLVRLDKLETSSVPPMREIIMKVEGDWLQERKRLAAERYFEQLLQQYPVVYR